MRYIFCICLLLFSACAENKSPVVLGRCEQIVGINGLDEYVASTKKMRSATDGEYYRLTLQGARVADLKRALETKGFLWERGGIEYSPINVGGDPSEDWFYALNKESKVSRVLAISEKERVLYVVIWKTGPKWPA